MKIRQLLAVTKTPLICILVSTTFVVSSARQNTTDRPKDGETLGETGLFTEELFGRLPTSLQPLHYTIRLQPFLKGNLSIHGSVDIRLKVLQVTDKVVLNMADIITKNESVKIQREGTGSEVNVVRQVFDPKFQLYTAYLSSRLYPNTTFNLHMDFQGFLNDKLVGFYRSTYTDSQGITWMVAGTQFSPTDARRAFPSLDEPALKATFDIHLARLEDMIALSNMPLLRSTPAEGQPGWVWDTFSTTLPMSTYLVGFLVCDYSYTAAPASSHNHTVIKVWTRAEALNQTSYAISVAPALLSFLEHYFQVTYPLPKLDMATMSDFKFSAMENWGLILYRESALLYDPEKSSSSDKQNLGNIIAHEVAHQWFGNLVTPAWWSDLWLKEGFATYLGYIALNATEPSWEVMDQFLLNQLQLVLVADSLLSTHPIIAEVNNPDEISQMFDIISYRKGASIIRMMQHFLTEDTFRKGLKSYLNVLKYQSAEQNDLWRHLTQAAREDGMLVGEMSVKEVMDSWTLQKGYPVISLARNGTTATLTQNWFLLDDKAREVGPSKNSSSEGQGWWVPISYTTKDFSDFHDTHPRYWMAPTKEPLQITGLPEESQWVVLNIQQTGYYRVNYNNNNWHLLIAQLETGHTAIHPSNRAQILSDAFNLARAGLLDYATALGTTTYLVHEKGYVPWKAALSSFQYLRDMFGRSAGYGSLREYLRLLVVQLYDSVGFDDQPASPHVMRLKRVVAVAHACRLAHLPCINRASQLFTVWLAEPHNASIVTGNTAATVLCIGVAAGGEKEWQAAWDRYTHSNVGSERETILTALGCTREVWLLAKYLEMAVTPGSGVRKQDARKVFNSVAYNPIGRDLAWNFLQDRWNYILEYLGPGSLHLSNIIKDTTNSFNTQLELKELERFKSDNSGHLGSATRALDQALESTRLNVQWMKNNYQPVVDWLAAQHTPGAL